MKVLLMYLPVLHRGYREFIDNCFEADKIMLFDDNLIREFPHLRKNVPALNASEVRIGLEAMGWNSNKSINLAAPRLLKTLNDNQYDVIMPDEDVSREAAAKYLPDCNIEFRKMFLRWDKQATTEKIDVIPDCEISTDIFDQQLIGELNVRKEHSKDFWRQVAAAVVINKEVKFFAHNVHVPDEENPYFYGDPRFNFSRGVEVELGTAEHAEKKLISLCAKDGIATLGASLYVTTFPCPACAKSIATAGFAKCFFHEGYTMLDAESILKSAGVEIIHVK